MKIKRRPFEDFDDFELDVGAIVLHSTDKKMVRLPYSGALPNGFASQDFGSAEIRFNIRPTRKPVTTLAFPSVKSESGLVPLSATPDEISFVLKKFFDVRNKTGLDPYWLGLWHGFYMDWEEIIRRPESLVDTLSSTQDDIRRRFIKRLNETK